MNSWTKPDQFGTKFGGNYYPNMPMYQAPPPTFQPQNQMPTYAQFQNPQNTGNSNNVGKKKRIDPAKIHAQTMAINQLQNAVSQLEFNRTHYAKDSIKKALAMIQKYND